MRSTMKSLSAIQIFIIYKPGAIIHPKISSRTLISERREYFFLVLSINAISL